MKCTKCFVDKPSEKFPWRHKGKQIKHRHCSDCYDLSRRNWYQNHKEKQISIIMASRATRRQKLYDYVNKIKESTGCQHCPESRIACLQFHHIDPMQKDINIAQLVGTASSLDKVQTEIKKCIILCANCHIIEHERLRK